MDKRCFCFLLLRAGGFSRRFRFCVDAFAVGVVLLACVCAIRCLFVGRGELSSVIHLRGAGSAEMVPAVAAVANVTASVPAVS